VKYSQVGKPIEGGLHIQRYGNKNQKTFSDWNWQDIDKRDCYLVKDITLDKSWE